MADKHDSSVHITVEEDNNTHENLKEVRTTINTLEQGIAITNTDIIDGELICVIIVTNKPINIEIAIETYPEVAIYSVRDFKGSKYVPLRTSAIAENGETFNFGPEKWAIKDRLIISVDGAINTQVDFIFRYR